jgi:hypothetical protein
MPKALVARQCAFTYFNELLMLVNFVFRLVPRPLTTAMIASEMLQSDRIRWRWPPDWHFNVHVAGRTTLVSPASSAP